MVYLASLGIVFLHSIKLVMQISEKKTVGLMIKASKLQYGHYFQES